MMFMNLYFKAGIDRNPGRVVGEVAQLGARDDIGRWCKRGIPEPHEHA